MPSGILILAAGLGKRMKSPLPKVLHPVAGEPMLFHLLHCVKKAAPGAKVGIIVGYRSEQVESAVRAESAFAEMPISFIHQAEQKGTGHAVRCAMDSEWGQSRLKEGAQILVLPGDAPLIRPELIEAMLAPLPSEEVLRLLTVELPNPHGYGRVLRSEQLGESRDAAVLRIVEEKDATVAEKQIREVAASTYTFQAQFLAESLPKLKTKNAQAEYYLTDLVEMAGQLKMSVLRWPQAEDLTGVNDLWEITVVNRLLNLRTAEKWAREGVYFISPESNFIGREVQLALGVTIYPGVVLKGRTSIGAGSTVSSFCALDNVEVGERALLRNGTIADDSVIEDDVTVGPYAHLRPGSKVGRNSKVGNFVELKKTSLGEGTSVAHLSYLGDATVGARVNIGCGFVTCNYDGRVKNGLRKHPTTIEDDAFIGSDCQAVAPIRIGKGAYVASGSTITKDVGDGDLGIARTRQENKIGYAARLRPKKKD